MASDKKRARRMFASDDEDEQQEEPSFLPDSENNSGEEPESSRRHSNTMGSMISVSFTDPDVLDCDVCFEPLTAPVFQCKNGHIACDRCCKKLKNNKCPSCTLQICSIRCLAMEKILESIRVSCQNSSYGCKETSLLYSQKQLHETTCDYSQCPCPFANCDYQSTAKKLSLHFNKKHPYCSKYSFKYDQTFSINLDREVECIVLEEGKEGDLFAVTTFMNYFLGTAVFVSRIIGTPAQRRHLYKLNARIGEPEGTSHLRIQSFTRNHVPCKSSKCTSTPPAGKFLMIPKDFFDEACSDLRQVGLSLCIQPSV